MHTHAGNTLHSPVTLTFDLLTSGLMHSEDLLQSICVPSLVLVALVVSLLERGVTNTQTHKVTDSTGHLTDASAIAGAEN